MQESELGDQDVTRFMPAMYEVFLKQGEAGFDEASETLANDMTQYWFSWKGLKRGLKKVAGSKLGKILINQVKCRIPGARAMRFRVMRACPHKLAGTAAFVACQPY